MAPTLGPAPALQPPEVQRFTLTNGLPVLLVEKHDLPLVAVELLFPGGAGAVPPAQAGLASFTADMLDESAGSRSAIEIAVELERLGAVLGSSAGYDDCHLHLLALAPQLGPSLDLLADLVMSPTFPDAEIERVRDERMDVVLKLTSEPRSVANDALSMLLYGPEHPWGPPLIGTDATLAALRREDVVAYHAARYHAGNGAVLVAGDVTRAQLEALLETKLGRWESRPTPASSLPPAPERDRPTIHLCDRPGAGQSEIRVGRVAAARDTDDYFALIVLNTVLGGSFTSRLNAKLREEKGFTYGARSGFHTRRAPGPFVAQAAVHSPATAESVGIVLEELECLREDLVPEEELERAKAYAALRLPQRFETVGDHVGRLAEQVLYDLPADYWSTYNRRLLEVDAAAVHAAALRHLDPRRMAVVIDGDRASIESPLAQLGLPIEVLPKEVA